MKRALIPLAVFAFACGVETEGECVHSEAELSIELTGEAAFAVVDCTPRGDVGYTSGNPFSIEVVTVDDKAVEVATGNAYWVMKQAALSDGVNLTIVSGFRTMGQQEYLYGCYVNCNCNNCNLAATPGYSNHQSWHALDLNTSAPGVLTWLNNNGAAFGFSRTVPSEAWHWEWWGGGPGGGICGVSDPACDANPNFAGCDGSEIERCVDGQLERGDCGVFGGTCSTAGGAHCVHPYCVNLVGGEDGSVCTDEEQLLVCTAGAAELVACELGCDADACALAPIEEPVEEEPGEEEPVESFLPQTSGVSVLVEEEPALDLPKSVRDPGCSGVSSSSALALLGLLVFLRFRRRAGALALLGLCACAPDLAMGDGLALERSDVEQASTVCGDGQEVFGIDVSYWQSSIDWEAVADGGARFAFIRASHGLGIVDDRFPENWRGAEEFGIARGVYQYFEPGEDVALQAALVLEHLDEHGQGELPPVIDVESTSGLTASVVAARVGEWIDIVEGALGVQPIIYSGRYFWQDNVGNSGAYNDHPLWHAQYTNAACPNIADAWSDWSFWQYSSTGSISGINGNVDLNRFNGSYAQLLSLAGAPIIDDDDPLPEPDEPVEPVGEEPEAPVEEPEEPVIDAREPRFAVAFPAPVVDEPLVRLPPSVVSGGCSTGGVLPLSPLAMVLLLACRRRVGGPSAHGVDRTRPRS